MPTLADYPQLVAQLDRKNGAIAPESITYASNRKLWWRCPAGPDHVWEAVISGRTCRGRGCPFCANQAVSVTNALSKVAPALARQWHPTKNGDLRPRDVVAGGRRAAWWKCPMGPDHVWEAKIDDRMRGKGCPFCSGRRASRARNFAVAWPALAAEWHEAKNGALRPEDVPPCSNRIVWWRCPTGHEWSARPNERAQGNGCPFCSGHRATPERTLAALAPKLARQWHPTKNGRLTPRDVTLMSNRRVFWKCPKGPDHEWQTHISNRSRRNSGCPFCAGKRLSVTNSLAALFPKCAGEWHPTKNGRLTPHHVVAGTTRRVWWRCAHGHEWQTAVSSRTTKRYEPRTAARKPARPSGDGCPYCANLRVSPTNSLAARFPKLAREWHPTKNGRLTPHDVIGGSHRRVWWRCASGHAWQAAVYSRSAGGTGCPECYRLRREAPVATTGKRRRVVRFAEYEGARHGPVRRVK